LFDGGEGLLEFLDLHHVAAGDVCVDHSDEIIGALNIKLIVSNSSFDKGDALDCVLEAIKRGQVERGLGLDVTRLGLWGVFRMKIGCIPSSVDLA
jgi:hypothetical protein